MTTWDGRGLPPAAAARMERFQASPLRTSLLSAPAVVALASAGFDPVGEVMGCIVQQIGWRGFYGGCGYGGMGYAAGRYSGVVFSTATYSGFGPYVRALNYGWDTALGRLLMEAKSMGADGVVGIRLTAEHLGSNNREFVALGTAVRARSNTHLETPFTTELPGTDVTKLLMAGWAPVALQIGLEVAIRHDDYRTQRQAGSLLSNYSNVEVSGYTDLVQQIRAATRERLRQKIAQSGADGGIVSNMSMHVSELEIGEGHRDHVAEASITGTALARFHTGSAPPTGTLTVLPVRSSKVRG
jgi:uncharacterized protein YbjQ (UPF0145 family)